MQRTCSTCAGFLIAIAIALGNCNARAAESQFEPAAVEFFEKKVRPILVARCHECHAGEEAKGSLRLDSRAAALAGGDTGPAVVVGNADESLLIDAVRYGDLYQMPPNSQLPAAEIETLVEWVKLGAPWGAETAEPAGAASKQFDIASRAGHWSYQPIARTEPPEVRDESWIRTPVDRFLLAKLEAAGIQPAPPADRRTLLRRVTFDLTGLPPTPAEIEAFLGDQSAGAYQRVVDRLLASPHYGERWARHWLDLVRFAETHGHEFDFEIADAYRYRDYVIRALNADLPYDQFVVEHIAGDLLPTPRRNHQDGSNESIVATGWYFFGEAVHSPVDIRADEATRVDNQIDVFAKTFLGLTVSCARCHDHKFDAISTKDYYALAGYLQSSRFQNASIERPEALQDVIVKLQALRAEQDAASRELARATLTPKIAQLADMLVHADTASLREKVHTQPEHMLYPWATLSQARSEGSTEVFSQRRSELIASLSARHAEGTQDSDKSLDFDGRGFSAWTATGDAFTGGPIEPLEWEPADFKSQRPARLVTTPTMHSGRVSGKLQGTLRSPTFEITGPKLWYRVFGTGGRVRLIIDGFQLIRNPIYGGLEFPPGSADPHWHQQDLSKWVGHRGYIELIDDGDGYLALEQVTFADEQPQAAIPNSLVLRMLDDASLDSPRALALKYQQTVSRVIDDWLSGTPTPAGEAADRARLVAWAMSDKLLDEQAEAAAQMELQRMISELAPRQDALEANIQSPRTVPAMADGTGENERVFIRGNHKTLGDEVPRRFLEVLGGDQYDPPKAGSGRLNLAEQMVSPDCPLVPRVIVNRLWHHHFGSGIVRSPDDFGVMGQPPTHPELLDYLAGELVANGWSLKHMHRQMVLSNAYRMSSQVRPDADQADPENKLWHRMEVRRLEAECIRDAVLAVSGKLNAKMYGPGVMPYLTDFMVGRGRPNKSGPLDGNGRRSIYLMVRRNFLTPMFLAFDYPTPFTTIGRRGTSNVPAQALTMMNNPLVIEQAANWADRTLAVEDATPSQRIRSMYVQAFAREPDQAEMKSALEFVAKNDRRSWTDLAHVLFNVKEFIYIP